MSHDDSAARPGKGDEYPDAAGYPDGTGTLDEGTADASVTAEGRGDRGFRAVRRRRTRELDHSRGGSASWWRLPRVRRSSFISASKR